MKITMLSTIAAAILAVSATAALADGMDADFYAIQRGFPYAGAPGPVDHSARAVEGRRVFLNGYEASPAAQYRHHHVVRRIER